MGLTAAARPLEAVQIWRQKNWFGFWGFPFFSSCFSNAHSYFYMSTESRNREAAAVSVCVLCGLTTNEVEKEEDEWKRNETTSTTIHLNLFVSFAVQIVSTKKRWTSVFCGVLFEHIEYSFYLLCANAVIARTDYIQR